MPGFIPNQPSRWFFLYPRLMKKFTATIALLLLAGIASASPYLEIKWQPVTNATNGLPAGVLGYRVFDMRTQTVVADVDSSVLVYQLQGVDPSDPPSIAVAAYNQSGEGQKSTTVLTDPIEPTIPTQVDGVTVSLILGTPEIPGGDGGNATNGSSYVITGTGFGSKGGLDANKAVFFSDWSVDDQPIAAVSAISGGSFDYSESNDDSLYERVTSGVPTGLGVDTTALEIDQVAVASSGGSVAFGYDSGSAIFNDVYVYMKRYYDYSRSHYSNMKTLRFYSQNDHCSMVWNDGSGVPQAINEHQGNSIYSSGAPKEQWYVEETTFVQSSNPGTSRDAFFWRQRNGVTIAGQEGDTWISSEGTDTTTDGNGYYQFWMEQREDNDTAMNNGEKVYWASVYMDTTRAHVLFHDASTYATSTKFEIQPPISWSNTSITVRARQGALSSGLNYYTVWDASGNIAATGSVTFN